MLQKPLNTANPQFCSKVVFDVLPANQRSQPIEIPSLHPLTSESDLLQLAENLESLVMSQSEVLLNLSPPFFTRVVEMNMRSGK
jgi:hypothetical protein